MPAEHRRGDGAGGDADEQDVIQTDAVVAILQRQDALNLMGLDHRLQDVGDRERFLSGAGEIIGQGEDAAQVVRRMAPLGGEPGIVIVEPANHRADIKRGVHGLQLPIGARHAGAVSQRRAGNDRTEMLGAFGKTQREQAAAQGVEQIIARRVDGFAAGRDVTRRVVGNLG